MRTHTFGATLAVLCLPMLVAAARQAGDPALTLTPQSQLWVGGTSTVRSFKCTAGTLGARVEAAGAGAVGAVLAGEKAVRAAALTVPAKALDCRNGTMNEHMLKALKADAHPTIGFTISSYEVAKADASLRGTATGELTLGGVTRTITVAARLTEDAGGALRIAGTHELNMREYGLKPPTLMMGTMRVNEKVTVGFDLRLTD
jgi:polyisoprenoid-binding protein YceI